MEQKIDVVGISCDDAGSFSIAAQKALIEADVIFASDDQIATVQSCFPRLKVQFKPYPKPISELEKSLPGYRGQKIVMMALGDPLFYGIGAILLRFLPVEQLRFHSATSSLQAALSRFGIPWNDLSVISLHGRQLSSFPAMLKTKGRYGVLTDKQNSPPRIAGELVKMGHKKAIIRVAESLGRSDEKLSIYRAEELAVEEQHFSPLLVLIIDIA